tara:strand:- start:2518 stop:4209 length:1692 start_codon:yes stop_codon:yes gene_type:complete
MENNTHKILALKYRPKNFEELIGQNIMVETITNSIKLDKLPNAYLLTGIRGVGKTTTARLIARALNCEKNFLKEENCNCNHCSEITNSRHLDVLEIDSASKTGIDDVRELIDSSKYNPTSAKYKIIILDEVHMLSKQAFSGLLKTLEEPPPHLKFIFATTEVKKIPVTIISRCQRFDLFRVPINSLVENLKKILKLEKGNVTDDALRLIAKASEGSVRDSLSLLDRALVSQNVEEKKIDENFVRKMLGIADKSKVLNLLNYIFQGEQKKSIEHLREMVNEGIDSVNFLNELLETVYFIQQKKNIGSLDLDLRISETEKEFIEAIAKDVSTSTLIIFWQLILKVLDEIEVVSNPILSLEMLIVRLVHLKEMPSYENLIDSLKENNTDQIQENNNVISDLRNKKLTSSEENPINKISKDQIKNTIQTKPISTESKNKYFSNLDTKETILTFEQLVDLSTKKKEMHLRYDLEKNVNLIKFVEGKIDISFNQNLDKNFVRNLSEKLFLWTGKRWVISLSKEKGNKTFSEIKNIQKNETLNLEKNEKIYEKFKKIFPDGELLEVKKNE